MIFEKYDDNIGNKGILHREMKDLNLFKFLR